MISSVSEQILNCFNEDFLADMVVRACDPDWRNPVQLFATALLSMEPVLSHGLVYDVALSTRRMSLTSVQSLSEKVAPQPWWLHHTCRKRERDTHKTGNE